MASSDRPPQRPSKAPAPRASSAVPGAPAPRPSEAQASGDKVAAAYQDLLKEIVEKKKQAAEIRKRPPKRRPKAIFRAVLAVILPPIVAAVWIFNPFAPPPPTSPRIPDDLQTWQTTLIDAALAGREWRDSAGVFPIDLAAADIPLSGVTFTVTGAEDFRLQTFTTEGVVTVWMSDTILGIGPPPVPVEPALVPPGYP